MSSGRRGHEVEGRAREAAPADDSASRGVAGVVDRLGYEGAAEAGFREAGKNRNGKLRRLDLMGLRQLLESHNGP